MVTGRATASPPTESDSLPKIVPGAITFQDKNSMMRVTGATAAGTMAYIVEEQALLVRVNNGWQYIAVRYIRFDRLWFQIAINYLMFQTCSLVLWYQ